MIGKLTGIIDEIGEDHCSSTCTASATSPSARRARSAALPGAGVAVTLFIETYVREDMIRLYGFVTTLEREWFRLLQSNVQGVGAKVALAILSTLTPPELANAIALRDIAMVSRAPGVGKKVAERIVTELKNKAPAFAGSASGNDRAQAGTRRRRRARAGRRRRLGADQSRLFARPRGECRRRGAEDGGRGGGFGEADPLRAEGTGAVKAIVALEGRLTVARQLAGVAA